METKPIKVSRKGREKLLSAIRMTLDNDKSGVPRDGIESMLVSWVKGLLENCHNDSLRKELEEE